MTTDKAMTEIGAVRVGDSTVRFQIASGGDFALLQLSVIGGDGVEMFVPIHASTYRGMPSVKLDVFTSRERDQIWVRSSWPDAPVLAWHRLSTETAVTSFGEVRLLGTPFPEVLSGGPVPFPDFDPAAAIRLATFYIHEAD